MIRIKQAVDSDLSYLEESYLKVLNFLQDQGFQTKPSQEAVDFMSEFIFQPAIELEQGPFIAKLEDETAVAALFCIADESPFPQNYRTATNYGQWVGSEFRGRGLTGKMFGYAFAHMKDLKVLRITDMVHTDRGKEAALSLGFEISKNFVTYKL